MNAMQRGNSRTLATTTGIILAAVKNADLLTQVFHANLDLVAAGVLQAHNGDIGVQSDGDLKQLWLFARTREELECQAIVQHYQQLEADQFPVFCEIEFTESVTLDSPLVAEVTTRLTRLCVKRTLSKCRLVLLPDVVAKAMRMHYQKVSMARIEQAEEALVALSRKTKKKLATKVR